MVLPARSARCRWSAAACGGPLSGLAVHRQTIPWITQDANGRYTIINHEPLPPAHCQHHHPPAMMADVEFTQSLVRITRHTLTLPPPASQSAPAFPTTTLFTTSSGSMTKFCEISPPSNSGQTILPRAALPTPLQSSLDLLSETNWTTNPVSGIHPCPSFLLSLPLCHSNTGLSRYCLWLLLRALPTALHCASTTSAPHHVQLTIITEAGQEDIPFTTSNSFFARLQQRNLKRLCPSSYNS